MFDRNCTKIVPQSHGKTPSEPSAARRVRHDNGLTCLSNCSIVYPCWPKFANAHPRLPLLARVCSCLHTLKYACERLPNLPFETRFPFMLRQVPKNHDSVREVLTLWGSKLDRFWIDFETSFGSILD